MNTGDDINDTNKFYLHTMYVHVYCIHICQCGLGNGMVLTLKKEFSRSHISRLTKKEEDKHSFILLAYV